MAHSETARVSEYAFTPDNPVLSRLQSEFARAPSQTNPAPRQRGQGAAHQAPRRGAGGGANREARRRRGRTSAPARRGKPQNSR